MADRHAVASGEEEKQHGENRVRDVHVRNRGSETANEEADKLNVIREYNAVQRKIF